MKKSKIALAAVVASVLGTSALGLAACSEDGGSSPSETPKGVYTITFDANGGSYASGVATPLTRKTASGKLIAFPKEQPVAPAGTDYAFKGWALTTTATEADKLDNTHVYKEDTTVYAIWASGGIASGEYTISFDANGGQIVSGSSTQTTVGGKLTTTLPTASNGEKSFLGWYKVKDSTSETDKVVENITVFDASGPVYASWGESSIITPQEYEITFDANGGKIGEDETKKITTVGGVISNLPTPELAGEQFLGWFTAKEGGTKITSSYPFGPTITTVYAHWETITGNTYIVGGKTYNLTDRKDWLKDQPDDRDRMFSIGSNMEEGVDLQPGDEISFKIDGAPIVFFVTKDSKGVAEAGTSTEVSKITVNAKKAANFVFYLAHYPKSEEENRDKACWSITVVADVEGGGTIVTPTPDTHTGTINIAGGASTSLTDNSKYIGEWDPTKDDDKDIELTVTVQPGNDKTLSFTVDDKDISFFLAGDSKGLRADGDGAVTSIKTLTDGTYTFYIKHYPVNDKHNPPRAEEVWSVYGEYTGATQAEKEDGVYAGDTLVKKLTVNTPNVQVKVEHIDLETGAELSFWWQGEEIVAHLKVDDANSKRVRIENDKLKVVTGGTFTMYLTLADGELWVNDEADRVASQLTAGDGMCAGGELKIAFTQNEGGLNELMTAELKLTETTALTLKYGGTPVSDYTLKEAEGNVASSALVGGTLTLNAGTYEFYYDYAAKTLYVKTVSGGTVVTPPDQVEDGYYIIGDDSDWKPVAINKGEGPNTLYEVDKTTIYGYEYKFTVTFTSNAKFKIAEYSGGEIPEGGWYAKLQGNVEESVATGGGDADIVVKSGGTYEVYLKLYTAGSHDIWLGKVGGSDVEEETTVSYKVGTGAAVALVDNSTQIPTGSTIDKEFMASAGIALDANDVISFVVNGKTLTDIRLAGESHGVALVDGGVKVLESGTFTMYIRFYEADDEGGDRWVVEMNDGKSESVGNIVVGDFYIVGSMNGWAPMEKYHLGPNGGSVTVKLYEGQMFKIAKSAKDTENGGYKADWSVNYVLGSVTSGRGYVEDGGENGNIKIKQTAMYTIKLEGGNIKISSDEIEEPSIDLSAYSTVTIKCAEGVTITLAFELPNWDGVSDPTVYLFKDGAALADAWPGAAMSGQSYNVACKASEIGVVVRFKQSGGDKQLRDVVAGTFADENGAVYLVTVGNWEENKDSVGYFKSNVAKLA